MTNHTPSTVEDWAASIEKAISESARELPPEIPPGYTLVPIEPTEEMIDAARNDHEGAPYLPVSLWRSMLAAAPKYNDGDGTGC